MSKSYMQIEKFDGTTPFKDFIRSLECVFTIEDVVDDVKKKAILMLYLSPEVHEVLDTIGDDQKATYTALKDMLSEIYNGEKQARRAGDQAKFYEFDYRNFEFSLRKFLKLVKDGFPSLGGKDLLATQISLLMQKIDGRMYDRLYTNSRQYRNAEDIVEDLVFAYRHSRRRRESPQKVEKKNFYTDLEKKFIGSMDRIKKCFNCHEEGHLARDCQKKVDEIPVVPKTQVNSNLVEQLDEGVSGPSYKIELAVDGKRIKTHCDTGTPVTLMTRRLADDLGLTVENVMSEKISVKGVANDELKVDGIVYVKMKVEDKEFDTPILVVSGRTTIPDDEILLGTNFTSQFVCTYTDNGVYFGKKFYPNLDYRSDIKNEGGKEASMVEMYPGLTVKLEDEEDRIFAKFDKVISKDDLDIGTIDFEIPRKVLNNKPYRRPPRFRYSPLQEALIVAYVKRLLENNIVVMKDTPYVTNFILVQSRHKKDDIRFAVDLRALNEITQPDLYVTKTPNELMNYLGEAELFSSLDIRKAFWSMKIPEEDIGYYGVFTPLGTICFLRMPFGDINAMPNFQRIYDKIILESVPKNSVAYVDDLLIFSKNDKTYHERLIDAAMSCFQKHGIKINKEKSKLMRKSVSFLGWEISNGQRKPGNQTTDLKNRKNPTNPKETKSLLGALNFFRDAIEGYSSIVRPIQEMANVTKKEFCWSEDCEKAKLEVFKKLETSLLIPRFDQEFYIYTDASMYAISGCILQKREEKFAPVKFYSKKLKYQKRQKSINLLEMQAIAYTLVANLELLYMAKITIFTDNRSVLTILRDGVDPDYTRYIAMISSFNYSIKYINTKDNGIADYLSRQEMIESSDGAGDGVKKEEKLESNVNAVSVSESAEGVEVIKHNVSLEERLAELQIMDEELQGEISIHPDLFIKLNDIWHKKIYVPEEKREVLVPVIPKKMRKTMLDIIHDSHGHMGLKKTWKLMKLMMYWPNSKTDLKEHIKSCVICQRYSDLSPELPLLKISQLPEQPFKVIAIDVGVVPNHGLIFQTICSLTRFWVPQVIKDQSAETLIEALNKGIFLRFGRPELIICDSYPSFISEQFTNFMKDLNIVLHVNVPYAKTQNSIVERSFRTMWDIMGKMREEMKENRLDFETMVMTAAYYYNTHYQLTTNETPFYLVFNKEERPFIIDRNSAALFDKYPVLADQVASMKQGWKVAAERANQVRSQDVERKNLARKTVSFDVGEKVLIRNHVRGKLEPNFSGPYLICKKDGDTYHMRKVGNTRGKFLVRNVADLKPYNELSDISCSSIEEDDEVEEPTDSQDNVMETSVDNFTETLDALMNLNVGELPGEKRKEG